MVLSVEPVVDDLPAVAQGMGAGVHQRLVFQMLVGVPGDRVDQQQRRIDRPARLGDERIQVQQVLPGGGHVGVVEAVAPERRLVQVPFRQQLQHALVERPVLHPEGDLVEVQRPDVFAGQESQHFVGRAVLRDVVPRRGVEFRRLGHHVERRGFGGDHELFVLADVHRELGELPRQREVERVVDGLGVVRFEVEVHRLRVPAVGEWHRPHRQLQQHRKFLPAAGRVGDHHLAAVDSVDDEFAGHELVEPLPGFLAVAVSAAVEILADEDRQLAAGPDGGTHLFVERDQLAGGGQGHPAPVVNDLVLARFVRQIEHGEGQHHLGEVPRGGRDLLGEEPALGVLGVVGPEGVHRNEVGRLLPNQELVVVVLGPLHGRVDLPVELPDSAFPQVFGIKLALETSLLGF